MNISSAYKDSNALGLSCFINYRPDTASRIRLFCFPYAGANSSIFREWINLLPSTVEVIGVELPGHGSRFNEPITSDLSLIINALKANFSFLNQKPFVFFGHSLGTKIAYELCRAFSVDNTPLPKHLIVSGGRAPHLSWRKKMIHTLPDAQLIEELKTYNGIPNDVFECPEIIELFLPILRADFTISETYKYIPGPPLHIPITALGGNNDPKVSFEEILGWKMHTSKTFNHQILPGNHFFIKESQKQLLKIINEII